ncbi:TRAP transporter small permease [Brevibacillus sp. B_LB10_24]|uniref:TRAP transporter small permease n=1 Tax=Brevibacillus sp. B_LB10_24 TaxID=3380645 RepID=UPI0038BA9D4D
MGDKRKGWFWQTDDVLASLTILAIIGVTVLGVFMRFVIGSPLKWTEEISLALFVWFTFIGTSTVTKRDEHISIDFFVARMPQGLQTFFAYFRAAVTFITFLVVFVYLGFQLSVHAWDKLTAILRLPYTFIDIAVPIGGALAAVHMLLRWAAKRKIDKGRGVEQ